MKCLILSISLEHSSLQLSRPVPEDLVPILAKDEQKQQEIIQKSIRDAEDRKARAIGTAIPPPSGALPSGGSQVGLATSTPANKAANRSSGIAQIPPFKGGPSKSGEVAKPTSAAPSTTRSTVAQPKRPLVAMHIPAIPPFDPSKSKAKSSNPAETSSTSVNGSVAAPSPSTTPGSKLNVNATSFRPNPNASAFKPVSSSSLYGVRLLTLSQGTSAASSSGAKFTTPPEVATTPNPYFGVRPINKADVRHVKDDFNPFKGNKLPDPRSIRKSKFLVQPIVSKSWFFQATNGHLAGRVTFPACLLSPNLPAAPSKAPPNRHTRKILQLRLHKPPEWPNNRSRCTRVRTSLIQVLRYGLEFSSQDRELTLLS